MDTSEILAGMHRIQGYLQAFATYNPLFQTVAEAAQAINYLFENFEECTPTKAAQLLTTLRAVEQEPHYNGSGWLDYLLHCRNLLHQLGYFLEAEQINC